MKTARIARLTVVLAASLLALVAADSSSATAPERPDYVPGRVIVGLRAGQSRQALGIGDAQVQRVLTDAVALSVPEGREREYAARYARRTGVTFAEPDYLRWPSLVPDDPDYHLQWDMPLIQAEKAWDKTRGAGVTIAVIDTGVAFEDYAEFGQNPELSQAQFVFPYNATDGSAHPNDDNGHGTHVTGTLAENWDDVGTAGLVPDAEIMPVKVCEPFGCPSSAMADGIRWAVDHGADILNMSLGGPSLAQIERDALAYAEENGVVAVAAAGNGGGDFIGDESLDYPAAVDTVIAAGAIDIAGVRTRYSNYGSHEGGTGLLVVAPGGNTHADLNNDGIGDGILQSTYTHSCYGGQPDYTAFSNCLYNGTSMATPHVSGTVAMLLSRYPDLTPGDVRAILACSSLDLGDPGEDTEYGAGLVHAADAMVDTDKDGTPNCLEARPEVRMSVSGWGPVLPGGAQTVTIKGNTIGGAIGSFDFIVTFDPNLVQATGCVPQPSVQCSGDGSSVRLTGVRPGGYEGYIEVGDIKFKALGDAGQNALLELNGRADGFSASDPRAVMVTFDGRISIKYVPKTVSGDLNCDMSVTSADVTQAIQYNLGLASPFCHEYGDVNCSGALDTADVLALLTYLAQLQVTVPTGCPLIGVPDPTPTPSATPEPSPTETGAPTPSETPTPAPS